MSIADGKDTSSKNAFDHEKIVDVIERSETPVITPFDNVGRPPLKQPFEHTRGAALAVQAGGVTGVDHATRDSTLGATVACAADGGSDTANADVASESDPGVIEAQLDDEKNTSTSMNLARIVYGWTVEKSVVSLKQAEQALAVEAALRNRFQHPDPSGKTLAI